MYKITFKKTIGHLKVVLNHKHEVFKACSKAGHIWMGLKHDLSKFSPTEFWESVKYFNGKNSPINVAKQDQGFSYAWFHHRGRNKHHFDYWIDHLVMGGIPALMPFKHVVELFCDYMGAGKAYAKAQNIVWTPESAYEYWINLKNDKIHPVTLKYIDTFYENLMSIGLDKTLKSLDSYKKSYYEDYEIYKEDK